MNAPRMMTKTYTVANPKHTDVDVIENNIKSVVLMGDETLSVSDGFHTMDELYEHRFALFIALAKQRKLVNVMLKDNGVIMNGNSDVWRSRVNADGSIYKGWFLLGMNTNPGEQITYHLPCSEWSKTDFADTLDIAPAFDGHTSQDVLQRLASI